MVHFSDSHPRSESGTTGRCMIEYMYVHGSPQASTRLDLFLPFIRVFLLVEGDSGGRMLVWHTLTKHPRERASGPVLASLSHSAPFGWIENTVGV